MTARNNMMRASIIKLMERDPHRKWGAHEMKEALYDYNHSTRRALGSIHMVVNVMARTPSIESIPLGPNKTVWRLKNVE